MKQKTRSKANHKKAKTVLRLPDLKFAKATVLKVVVRYSSCAIICFSSNVTLGNCEESAGKNIGCSGLMQVSISRSNSFSQRDRGACSLRNL